MTKPTDMLPATKIEFPEHPVVIGVNIVTREGGKTVSCVEYKEYQRLLRENEEMAEVLIELMASVEATDDWALGRDSICESYDKAREVLNKRSP